MKISNINDITGKLHCGVVTIGSFDGVHLGHREILKAVIARAKEVNGESVVVSFTPHPRIALSYDVENLYFLNSFDERSYNLENEGIDHLVIIPFDTAVSKLTMEEFFVNYIKEQLGARSLIIGYNNTFGSGRNFDYELLTRLADWHDIELIQLEKMGIDERDISSTTIRNLIKRGDMERANSYLGKPYMFMGDINASGELIYSEFRKLYPREGRYSINLSHNNTEKDTFCTIENQTIMIEGIGEEMRDVIIRFNSRLA